MGQVGRAGRYVSSSVHRQAFTGGFSWTFAGDHVRLSGRGARSGERVSEGSSATTGFSRQTEDKYARPLQQSRRHVKRDGWGVRRHKHEGILVTSSAFLLSGDLAQVGTIGLTNQGLSDIWQKCTQPGNVPRLGHRGPRTRQSGCGQLPKTHTSSRPTERLGQLTGKGNRLHGNFGVRFVKAEIEHSLRW